MTKFSNRIERKTDFVFARSKYCWAFSMVCIFVLMSSCSNDTDFSSSRAQADKKSLSDNANPIADPERKPELESEQPLMPLKNKEEFSINLPAVDIELQRNSKLLIVIDNSVSMVPFLEKVTLGFNELAAKGISGESKIGVINSMVAVEPAGEANLTPAAGLKSYKGFEFEPGFQSLVTAESIELFKSNTTANIADRFPLGGCSGWFAPDQLNAQGEPCIKANTQIARTSIGCEPLLHAYDQFVRRYKGTFDGFKELDVLFVSDEVGPGCGEKLYTQTIPTLKSITDATFANTPELKNIQFHGILRASQNGQMKTIVEEAKGKLIDIDSNAPEYIDIVEKIAKSSLKTRNHDVLLQHTPTSIEKITLGGEVFKGRYEFAGDRITFFDLPTETEMQISVYYSY